MKSRTCPHYGKTHQSALPGVWECDCGAFVFQEDDLVQVETIIENRQENVRCRFCESEGNGYAFVVELDNELSEGKLPVYGFRNRGNFVWWFRSIEEALQKLEPLLEEV